MVNSKFLEIGPHRTVAPLTFTTHKSNTQLSKYNIFTLAEKEGKTQFISTFGIRALAFSGPGVHLLVPPYLSFSTLLSVCF
jgi:hypothetical protein